MRRNEFLSKLKEALENDLDSRAVQENMTYYTSYINEEIAKGRSEEEVIDELGDPWVIARSIIDMAENQSETSGSDTYGYGSSTRGSRGNDNADGSSAKQNRSSYHNGNMHVFMMDSWWKKLLVILGIIGIVALVFTVVGGVISFLSPILMPVLIILILVRFFQRLR